MAKQRFSNFHVHQAGDTIVEVLIATAVISAVLVGAFQVVQKSVIAVRDSQEHSQVLQLLQGQVELARAAALKQTDNTKGVYSQTPKYFCMDPATGQRVDFDASFSLTDINNNNFPTTPAACHNQQNLYNVAGTYDKDEKLFTFYSHWDRLGGGQNQESVVYRIAPAQQPPPPAVVAACTSFGTNQIANGDFHISAGNGPAVDAAAGFISGIPNRGPDVWPDDNAVNGTSGQGKWTGGFSIRRGNTQGAETDSLAFPFLGDPSVAVPASNTYFDSNPNVAYDTSLGSSDGTHTFIGTLWKSLPITLQAGTTYQLRAYFDEPYPDTAYWHGESDPIIEFQMNDGSSTTTLMPYTPIHKEPTRTQATAWSQNLFASFTTDAGAAKQYNFFINDNDGKFIGDELLMTAVSVRQCKG